MKRLCIGFVLWEERFGAVSSQNVFLLDSPADAS